MKNPHAQMVAQAAEKYQMAFVEDGVYPEYIKQDYEDLMKIARKIENNDTPASIQQAIFNLDTLVRDVIPDKVYYLYNSR